MNTRTIAAVAALLTITAPATAEAAATCAVPGARSLTYDAANGEVVAETDWHAVRNHRVTIGLRAYVNGRLLIADTMRDTVMARYEHDVIIGTTNRPRHAAVVLTIRSEGCTRTVVMRRRFG